MKSKRSFFNAGLAKNMLRRRWPAWLLFAAVMLSYPIMVLNRYHEGNYNLDMILQTSATSLPMLMLVVGVLAAMLQFGYLYSNRACGLMNTLPIRRESAFGTAYLMGLLPMLFAELLAALVGLLLTFLIPVKAVSVGLWLLLSVCSTLCFYGIAVFCAMLTGNILVFPALYFVLNFVGVVVYSCLDLLLSRLLYGYAGSTAFSSLYWLSPGLAMNERISYINLSATEGKLAGLQYALIYAAVGVLLSLAALALYRRRKMECATDPVAIAWLRPVFQYCMTFGTALVSLWLVSSFFGTDYSLGRLGYWSTLLLMLLGAVVGWYAARMVLQKSVRVFKGGGKGLALCCLLIALGCTALELDLFGYERRVPAADEVSAVRFLGGVELKEPENIAQVVELHQRMVEHKARYDGKMAVYNGDSAVSQGYYLRYTLRDGSEMYRKYEVFGNAAELEDPDSDLSLYRSVMNSHEALISNNIPRIPVTTDTLESLNLEIFIDGQLFSYTLSSTEALDFYQNCLLPDIREEKIGYFSWIPAGGEYSNVSVNLNLAAPLGDYPELQDDNMIWHSWSSIGEYKHYQLPMDAQRSLDWIREHTGYDVHSITKEEAAPPYWGKG